MKELKLALFTLPRGNMTISEAMDYAASLGLCGFEPFFAADGELPDDMQIAKWRTKADTLGLTIPCVSVGANLCGKGGAEETEKLLRFAEIAHAFGAPLLHHTIYPPMTPDVREEDFEELLEIALPRLHKIWDYCASLGVNCVYEMQGFQFNGRKNFGELLRRLKRPAKIVLDSGNCAFSGEDPLSQLSDYPERIAHVHLKDFAFEYGGEAEQKFCLPDGRVLRRRMPGDGEMHLEELLRRLQSIGYDGWFSLECVELHDFSLEVRTNIAWFAEQYGRLWGK